MSTFFQLADVLREQRYDHMIELPEPAPSTPQSALLLNPVLHRAETTPRTPPRSANDDQPPAPAKVKIG